MESKGMWKLWLCIVLKIFENECSDGGAEWKECLNCVLL
jgi:hypothetical protein